MTKTTIHEPGTGRTTRLRRGVRLYREHAREIARTTANTYRVPSCTGEGCYLVHLNLASCSCPDHARAKAAGEWCKHFHAAAIASAKRRVALRRAA